ncbi:protein bric-a-brac 1 [Chelonus insularis]|uniref:protein bric-a-brac 1 n=1 Tax=Chelonus insularis TaxID=460826 RepID=UPI00158DBBCB|nr:protein bric-a-brac 1 [Chelonus insularis]XP_034952304.1 protein bric-a-brac 1 [Chelonus insularis]XP_034952305.1 protein bric-a-brac 1 [Chelonus insularis]XP_034952306.1 protein bric-a-brac 1 [Chelonus insularis]
MEGQQFCLRWHNFQNTLLSTLPKLLDGGYLTDVTLSAGGRHIRAHRIILSACSYYFKELFKDLSNLQHPVIVLPGMEYANLCALVTFMYNGEVNIYQEQLPALLAMADTLHIRGLADIAGKNSHSDNGLFIHPAGTHEDTELTQEPTIKEETNEETPATEILESIAHSNESVEDDSLLDKVEIPCSVKTKPYYSINAKLAQKEKKQSSQNGSQSKEKNLISDNKIENVSVNEEQNILDDVKNPSIDTNFRFLTSSAGRGNQMCNKTSVMCLICGKQLSNQYNLRVHMETHSNSSYSCSACSHVSRSRDALRKHVSYRHPVATPQKRPRYSLTKP